MTAFEYLQSEVQRLGGLAGDYERMYLRAKDASRSRRRLTRTTLRVSAND